MITTWNLYLEEMEAKAPQDEKEQEKHIKLVSQQNATLITMIQDQQKKTKELMTKNLINKVTRAPQSSDRNVNKSC